MKLHGEIPTVKPISVGSSYHNHTTGENSTDVVYIIIAMVCFNGYRWKVDYTHECWLDHVSIMESCNYINN